MGLYSPEAIPSLCREAGLLLIRGVSPRKDNDRNDYRVYAGDTKREGSYYIISTFLF
jgi:hypothetical protein